MDKAAVDKGRSLLIDYCAFQPESSGFVDSLIDSDDLYQGIDALIWIFISKFRTPNSSPITINVAVIRIHGKIDDDLTPLMEETKKYRANVYNICLIEPVVTEIWNHFFDRGVVSMDDYEGYSKLIHDRSLRWKEFRNAFELCVIDQIFETSLDHDTINRMEEQAFHKIISDSITAIVLGLIVSTVDFMITCMKDYLDQRTRKNDRLARITTTVRRTHIRPTAPRPAVTRTNVVQRQLASSKDTDAVSQILVGLIKKDPSSGEDLWEMPPLPEPEVKK